MNVTRQGIIALLKSAVTGEPMEIPREFSLEEAFEILSKQGLLPLAYQGSVNCGIPKTRPEMQKMLMHYYQHMVVSERQMRSIDQLLDAFEKNGIDHMPVKGCNMKHLYPKPELRSMGDADILIREEQFPLCAPIMRSLGYSLKLESDHTDNWKSDDLYVELHKSLVPEEDADYYAYYGTGWRIGVKGTGHRYDPTPEDTFIFLFTHFARHYRVSGIGCRHVLDLYVYRRAYPALNEKYICGEMKKLHLQDFYQNVLRLLDVWFGDGQSDEITELMTAFIFSGGSWGTLEASLYAQEVRKAGQEGNLRSVGAAAMGRALFPPLSMMKNRYRILNHRPMLLPVFWVVRWFDVVLFSPRKMLRKLRILRNMGEEKAITHRQMMNAVGLDFYSE